MSEKLEFIIQAKDEFSKSFSKITDKLPSLKSLATGAAAGVTALGGTLLAITKTTANTYDEFSKLSDQLGVSTDWLSKLKYQTQIGGVEWGVAQKAVQGFQVRIGEAAQGIGTAKDSFAAMGIELHKQNGQLKTSEELLPEVADALKSVQNATERTEIAQKLFGQRGISMLQIMTNGSAGMEELSNKAEQMGLVVSDVAARQAAAFNDSLTDATGVIKGLKDSIGVALMPMLTGLANKFSDFATENRAKIIEFGKSAIKSMAGLVEKGAYGVAILIDAFRGLQMVWESLKLGFGKVVEFILSGLQKAFNMAKMVYEKLNFGGIFDTVLSGYEKLNDMFQVSIDSMNEMSSTAMSNLYELSDQTPAMEKVEEYKNFIYETLEELDEAGRVKIEAETARQDFKTANLMTNLKAQQAARKAVEKEDKKRDDIKRKEEEKQKKEDKKAEEEKYKFLDDLHAEHLSIWLLREQVKNKSAYEMNEAQVNHLISTKEKGMEFLKKSGKSEFKIYKNMKSGEALINTYQAAIAAYQSLAGIPIIGPALGAAAASVAVAFGLQQAKTIQSQKFTAAHGGYTNIPQEQTMLVDKGERILSPAQNRDLTSFLETGGGGSQNINVSIMPNVTNPDVMLNMSRSDWDNIVETNIIPSLRRLNTAGVTV